MGLFDSLRQFTQNVGKLVNIVGDRLEDRRGEVVRVASNVDSQVRAFGSQGNFFMFDILGHSYW